MINIIWILSIYVVVILANAILNFTVSVYKIENIICKNHCFVKDIEPLVQFPIIIFKISQSVLRIPRLARRPTLAMVFSTPLVTMPSPP